MRWAAIALAAGIAASEAAALELDARGTELRAFIAARGILSEAVDAGGGHALTGIAEAEGGAEFRVLPLPELEATLGYSAVFQTGQDHRSGEHRGRGRVALRPWRPIRLAAGIEFRYSDDLADENTFRRWGADAQADWRPQEVPLIVGAAWRASRSVFFGVSGDPVETRNELKALLVSSFPEGWIIQGRIGALAAWNNSDVRTRSYSGKGLEAVLAILPARSLMVGAIGAYESRNYKGAGSSELWSGMIWVEVWLLKYAALEVGVDGVRYTGHQTGDVRSIVRGFAGIRIEI